ncbi:hypothetical protein [Bacterioplanes sanyensis]|nr:hypothetical protein [Bacterioplanes sanyensis]
MALLFSTVIINVDANNKVPSILLPLARYLPRLASIGADSDLTDKRP